MRHHRSIIVVLIVLLIVPSVALGSARGSPDLDATLPANTVTPGLETTLQIQLTNDGDLDTASSNPAFNDRVTTAKGVTVELRSGRTPISIETETQSIGRLSDGVTQPVGFDISVDEDAQPGTYELPIRVTYSHPSFISERTGAVEERTVTETLSVTIQIKDQARFQIINTTSDLHTGSTGTATITVRNIGSDTARASTVSLRSLNPDLRLGGTAQASRYVGAWEPGETRTITYSLTADQSTRPQEYAFEVITTFENDRGTRITSAPLQVGITPRSGTQFVVVSTSSDVIVGGVGTVTLTMRNTGTETVRDASVALRSSNIVLGVGGGRSVSRFVGAWEPGGTKTLVFKIVANRSAAAQPYALESTVRYETIDGATRTSGPITIGVPVAPELEFEVRDLTSTLHVGAEGTLQGVVVNKGNRPARNTVIVIESTSPTVVFDERTFPVGDIPPESDVPFKFDVSVPPSAEAGPRQFTMTVRYEDADDSRHVSDPINIRRPVEPERELVELTAQNATFGIDTSNRLTVRITNVWNEPLTDLNARLMVQSPFTSEAPTSFIDRLEPGETAQLNFELTVSEDAVANTHAVFVNITAETTDDRTVMTGQEIVPVTIAPEAGGGQVGTLLAGVVFVIVILGAGYWWLNQ